MVHRQLIPLLVALLAGCFPEPAFRTSDAEVGADAGREDFRVVPDVSGTDAGRLRDAVAAADGARVEHDGSPDPEPDPDPDPDPEPDPEPEAFPLHGAWVSEGADVAPLLRGTPSNVTRLAATFRADGRFSVQVTNRDRQRFTLAGTYTADDGTTPGTIELRQTEPDPVLSRGIWQVEGDTLTYEVAFVDPPIDGVSPPTAEGGFGSTSGGRFGRDNVQIYRRTE